MTLAEKAEHYYNANEHEALFQLAVQSWPPDGGDLPEGIGEVCRQASVRAAQMKRVDQHLWRARAMTAAVLHGARDTAAGLLLQAFFVTTAITVEQRSAEGHAHARKILDLMKMLMEDDGSRGRLFGRLYHEKRGFSFLMEASNGATPSPASLPILDAADAEYSRAREFTQGDPRGALKLRGGQALVRYLKLSHHTQGQIEILKEPLLEDTRRVMAASSAAGYKDIEEWAHCNAAVMERGQFDGWTAYDVV